MDGWMYAWVDGWEGIKAILRIALAKTNNLNENSDKENQTQKKEKVIKINGHADAPQTIK